MAVIAFPNCKKKKKKNYLFHLPYKHRNHYNVGNLCKQEAREEFMATVSNKSEALRQFVDEERTED